ncbi:hypothetical protein ACI77O_13010 [Pseudomonas tritici]|uniref:hypothetical protein n=1 Tax=Pseudomonas tritici TaxID=2745518 RepID=UPI00387B487A
MQKLTLTGIAAVILAGCASAPPEPAVTTYSYESKSHSGTVFVTDKHYTSDSITCASNWREGELYTPKGIVPMGRDHLELAIDLKIDGKDRQSHTIGVPLALGSRVVAKDFQEEKTWMLGTETNGLIQQGEHFEYPEGYFIRVSDPSVKGQQFQACVAIDHMYVLDADLQGSTNPPIYLDRVVVPFAMERYNQPVKVSFGSKLQHTAEIRVDSLK